MKYISVLTLLVQGISATALPNPPSLREQIPLHSSPTLDKNAGFTFPSIRESAAMARKIFHLSTTGDLVTVFPDQTRSREHNDDRTHANAGDDDVLVQERRPAEVAGSPIGLLEYYAACDWSSSDPILLAIDIATPYRNYQQGSNISLSIRWWPIEKTTYPDPSLDISTEEASNDDDDDDYIPTPHTPAALPRFSLHGYLETIEEGTDDFHAAQKCFLRKHPDSIYWQPGNEVSHESRFVRLVVEHVYWFGGFGDRARIGWLPIEDWKNVTEEEISAAKLPGERKRKNNSISSTKGGMSWWRQWL